MSWLLTLLRRTLGLAVLAGLGSAGYSWWRARNRPPEPAQPEWPPLRTAPTGDRSPPPATETAEDPAAAGIVTVDDARPSGNGGATWVAPNADGSCPITHPIKANDNSGIFHVPGGRFYERTGPERCYTSAEAAIADGYRQAKS